MIKSQCSSLAELLLMKQLCKFSVNMRSFPDPGISCSCSSGDVFQNVPFSCCGSTEGQSPGHKALSVALHRPFSSPF